MVKVILNYIKELKRRPKSDLKMFWILLKLLFVLIN